MERLLCYMSSAHLCCKQDWAACLDRAQAMGFDGVELFSEDRGVNFADMSDERCMEIARRARRAGLRISVHPWVKWDGLSRDDAKRRFRGLIKRCMRMEIREINMHLHFLATRGQGMGRVLDLTDACTDLLAQSDLLLLYENVPEHGARELGSELGDFERLFRHYGADSRIMLNIDTGHAHIMHQLAPLSEDFGARWAYTHVNDNDGRNDLHLAPGDGTLPIAAVAQAARRANYRGILTMEYGEDGLATGFPATRAAFEAAGYALAPLAEAVEHPAGA